MRRFLAILVACVSVSFFPACESLGLAPAQSLDQQVAYGYSTLAAVRSTAADLLNAKTIKVEDAKMVQSMADDVRSALDLAKVAIGLKNVKDAQAALSLANSVLAQLQAYLAKRKGGS